MDDDYWAKCTGERYGASFNLKVSVPWLNNLMCLHLMSGKIKHFNYELIKKTVVIMSQLVYKIVVNMHKLDGFQSIRCLN